MSDTEPLIPAGTWILCPHCGARQARVLRDIGEKSRADPSWFFSSLGPYDLSLTAQVCHWCRKDLICTERGGIRLFTDQGWLP